MLANSELAFAMDENAWNLPEPERIDGIEEEDIPYYLLGDGIFPLKPWLLRPYPGTMQEDIQVYNYRHSRARLPIENSFGILVARFRIFHRPIIASLSTLLKGLLTSPTEEVISKRENGES